MKRRLACLLRGWAHRLDPPPDPVGPSAADFFASSPVSVASASMTQPYAIPASWTWNGMEWKMSDDGPVLRLAASPPDPPRLRVVR